MISSISVCSTTLGNTTTIGNHRTIDCLPRILLRYVHPPRALRSPALLAACGTDYILSLNSASILNTNVQVVGFSVLNTVQCYISANFARRTYDGPASATQVTPFAGRLFGSWSFLSGLVRLYAAYNIHDRHLYQLALCTYLIVLSHFTGELLVFGTMKIGKGLAPSLFVATTSVVWMLTQWSFYLE